MPIQCTCLVCNKIFLTQQSRIDKGNGKFCSHHCLSLSQRNRITRNCLTCKKVFDARVYQIRKGYGKFCCSKCYFLSEEVKIGGKMSGGRKVTQETRQKIRSKNLNWKPLPHQIHPWTMEMRVKASISRRGERGYWWRGGRTNLTKLLYHGIEYRKWRKAVFVRDHYTCQFCKLVGGKLNADHIKPRSVIVQEYLSDKPQLDTVQRQYQALLTHKELWCIENGRTLCEECHRLTDTYGGRIINKLTNVFKSNRLFVPHNLFG